MTVLVPVHAVVLAGSYMVSVNLNTGRDKQEWEDSCNVSADSMPNLNNSTCTQRVMHIKMDATFSIWKHRKKFDHQQQALWERFVFSFSVQF